MAGEVTPSKNLANCPFCGAEASFEEIASRMHSGVLWSVGCSDESCYGWQSQAKFNTKAEAAAAWNKRMPVRASSGGAPNADQTAAGAALGSERKLPSASADLDLARSYLRDAEKCLEQAAAGHKAQIGFARYKVVEAVAHVNEHARRLAVETERLQRIDTLMDAQPGTPEGAELNRLVDEQVRAEALLFDGFAVLQELRTNPKAAARTSAENVSDVLDAVVRLLRSAKEKESRNG